jgi:hypothetical protein
VTVQLLALILNPTNNDEAVAIFGMDQSSIVGRLTLPFAEMTRDAVQAKLTELQGKLDTLLALAESFQPKIVTAAPAGAVVPFKVN